jgi:hypothetical protein
MKGDKQQLTPMVDVKLLIDALSSIIYFCFSRDNIKEAISFLFAAVNISSYVLMDCCALSSSEDETTA